LIHLIRGGAELEMRWTGAGPDDAYALMTSKGEPLPAGLAKQLFVQHVRFGDRLRFPETRHEVPGLDSVIAWDEAGRRSGVFVNTAAKPVTLAAAEWDNDLSLGDTVLRLDGSTGNRIARQRFDGTLRLEGHGLAVVTNGAEGTVID
jgi:hypothetical protein